MKFVNIERCLCAGFHEVCEVGMVSGRDRRRATTARGVGQAVRRLPEALDDEGTDTRAATAT